MKSLPKKTKAKVKMIEMGIVPAFTGKELSEMLSSLSHNEKRLAKRKFRKAWRKIAKNNKQFKYLLSYGKNPDTISLRNRSCTVVSEVVKSIK